MRASQQQRGFVAAMLHRLSGIALAIFLPIHFLALASALNGAKASTRSSPLRASRSSWPPNSALSSRSPSI